jgi:hypothetical protein
MTSEAKSAVDEVLEGMKGSLESAIVIGMDSNGHTVIKSSVTNVPFMHWMLNRSIFELGLFEKQSTADENEEAPES